MEKLLDFDWIMSLGWMKDIQWLFDLAFSKNTTISRVVITTIVCVTALIVFWLVAQGLVLAAAWIRLWRFRRKLSKKKEGTWTREEIEKMATWWKVGAWLSRKIAAAKSLSEDVNATTQMLDQIDAGIAWRVHGILKFPVSTLIIFGLLGTVWGLQASLFSLLPTLRNEMDLAQLQKAMAGTLAGMQTAFSTTLAGLICSIIAGLVIMVLLKTFLGKHLESQNKLVVERIMPVFSTLGADRVSRVTEQSKIIKESFDKIIDQRDLLFKPVVESAASMQGTVKQFHSAAHTMVEVSDKMDKLGVSIEGGLQRLGSALGQVSGQLEGFSLAQERIEESLTAMLALPDRLDDFLTRLADSFDKARENQALSQQQLVGEQVGGLKRVFEEMRDQANQQREQEQSNVDRLIASTDGSNEKMAGNVTGLVDNLKGLMDRIEDLNSSFARNMDAISSNQEQVGESYLAQFKQQMEEVRQGLSGLLARARQDEENRNQQMIGAMSEWISYNQFLAKMLHNLDELPKKLGQTLALQNETPNKPAEGELPRQ